MPKQLYVLSVGGSMIANVDGVNVRFLKLFAAMIRRRVKKGDRFVIVTGGGRTARTYIEAGSKVTKIASEDLDWLGIHATRLNAHLLRTILRDISYPVVVKNPARPTPQWNQPVMVAAGWKPGWSTDYVATRLAHRFRAATFVNISNVDYIYDRDPKKYRDAKRVEKMSWAVYRGMVGDTWDPGMNLPFDPVASKLAQTSKLKVYLVGGGDLKNIERLFQGKSWNGSMLFS